MPTIVIGGDVCPIGANRSFFERGDSEALLNDLEGTFRAADLVIANLECPLIEAKTPIAKTGPLFGESTACINGIRAAGIDVVCLANNHILDHGTKGLESTLSVCAAAGIQTVGAGTSLAEAGRMLIRRVGALRVGIVAMAEHEFSVATPRSAGANPLDLIAYVRTVRAARDTVDYLIVLLHGGHEFLTAPSPRLRETCRFIVEMGANAVIVQHPHAQGGCEDYEDGHIVYGQGALVMDEPIYRGLKCFHESLLVVLDIAANGTSVMSVVPVSQSDPIPGVRHMNPSRATGFLSDLEAKSRTIQDDQSLEREWRHFCAERKHGYLSALLAHGRVLRRANRHGLLSHLLYGPRRLLATRNVICCESHREVLETILTQTTS